MINLESSGKNTDLAIKYHHNLKTEEKAMEKTIKNASKGKHERIIVRTKSFIKLILASEPEDAAWLLSATGRAVPVFYYKICCLPFGVEQAARGEKIQMILSFLSRGTKIQRDCYARINSSVGDPAFIRLADHFGGSYFFHRSLVNEILPRLTPDCRRKFEKTWVTR